MARLRSWNPTAAASSPCIDARTRGARSTRRRRAATARRLGRRQRPLEPAAALVGVAADLPEPPQPDRRAEAPASCSLGSSVLHWRAARRLSCSRLSRSSQAPDSAPWKNSGAARSTRARYRSRCRRRTASDLARRDQPIAGVQADRLEQPVAAVARGLGHDERLLDQPRQEIEDVHRIDGVRRRRRSRPPRATGCRRRRRAGAGRPARPRRAGRSSSPSWPAGSAGVAPRPGSRRSAAGTGRRAGPRSGRPTATASGQRRARVRGGSRRAAGTAGRSLGALSAVTRNAGWTAIARSANSATASDRSSSSAEAGRRVSGSDSDGTG